MVAKPPLPLNIAGEPRAFFGRRSGKRLHSGQDRLYQDLLPRLELPGGTDPVDPAALFGNVGQIIVEIGYGGGEHLALEAERAPETGFIGCEVFSGGIAKLLQHVETRGLDNIRLFTDDALKLLVRMPAASVDGVYLLYPDPWPKTRHHKRRFVSPTTLAELARVIRPGGFFRFATDIEDYANWTLAHVLRAEQFAIPVVAPGSWHQPFAGWEATRYEQKARAEGRMTSFYFDFVRR